MSDDFCLLHGYEYMRSQIGNSIPYCEKCDDEMSAMIDHNNASAWGLAQRFAAAPACDDQCGSVYVTLGVVTAEQRDMIVEALRASLETQKSPPTQ